MLQKSLVTRLCCAVIVMAVLLPLVLSCKSAPEPTREPVPSKPFTTGYEINESNARFFTDSDSVALLSAASPFYVADQPLPSQNTGVYERARARKIEEIKEEAQTLVQTVIKMKPKLEEVRGIYLTCLEISLGAEPKLSDFVDSVLNEMQNVDDSKAILEAQFDSIDTTGLDNAYARSLLDYMKVVRAAELGALYLQDMDDLAEYAGLTLTALSGIDNPTIKKATEKLDGDMKALDSLRSEALAIITSRQKIDYGLRQLDTGSYYYALAANDFIKSSLADLEVAADRLTPREGLTKADIQAIQQYLALFERQLDQVNQVTNAMDKSNLITVSAGYEYRPGVAYAAEPPANFAKAVSAVQEPAKANDAANKQSTYFSKDWAAVRKDAQSNITRESKLQIIGQILRTPQQGIGELLDVAKIANDYAITLGYRKVFGIPKEVLDEDQELSRNWIRFQANLETNMSGAEILNNAAKAVKSTEEGAGKLGYTAFKTIGTAEWMATGAGEVSRLGVGLVTGMAGSMYTLANQTSTPTDMVLAGIDLAISLHGGSKTLMTAPLMKTAEEKLATRAATEAVTSMMNGFSNLARSKGIAKAEALAALANGSMKEAETKLSEYMAKAALEKQFKAIFERSLDTMEKLPKGKLAAFADKLEKLGRAARKARIDATYRDGLRAAFGKNSFEFALNILGAWGDEQLKMRLGLVPLPAAIVSVPGTTLRPSATMPTTAPASKPAVAPTPTPAATPSPSPAKPSPTATISQPTPKPSATPALTAARDLTGGWAGSGVYYQLDMVSGARVRKITVEVKAQIKQSGQTVEVEMDYRAVNMDPDVYTSIKEAGWWVKDLKSTSSSYKISRYLNDPIPTGMVEVKRWRVDLGPGSGASIDTGTTWTRWLKGTVSATTMSLQMVDGFEKWEFTFTTDLMSGGVKSIPGDVLGGTYYWGRESDPKAFNLTRQK